MVSTWQQTNATTQTVAAYPGLIDGDVAVATRVADAFAPHQRATPNMAVELDPGFIYDPRNTNLVTVAAQSTGTFTAPVSQPRIDRVVVDAGTGLVSVVTGTEAASPVPPAIPAGTMPIAQVALQTTTTAITNALLTDERGVWGPPVPGLPWAVATGSSDAITASYAPANASLYDGLLLSFRASAANTTATPSFAPDGLTAYVITKEGGDALVPGDIPGALAECLVRFNAANTRWELLNPQQGVIAVAAGTGIGISETSGTVTVSNTGVTSLASGGAGIGVSASTGSVTVSNTGVTSLSAGTGISVSSSTGGVTISATGSTSPFSAKFISSAQTIPSPGVTVTIAHGLGAIPFAVSGSLICVTANLGWNPGNTIWFPVMNEFFAVSYDATNIYVTTQGSGVLSLMNRNTGFYSNAAFANWNFVLMAWV